MYWYHNMNLSDSDIELLARTETIELMMKNRITVDFGDSCKLNNGSVVSGKIVLTYAAFIAGTRTINYTFENYFYNSNGVTGGGEIFRERI